MFLRFLVFVGLLAVHGTATIPLPSSECEADISASTLATIENKMEKQEEKQKLIPAVKCSKDYNFVYVPPGIPITINLPMRKFKRYRRNRKCGWWFWTDISETLNMKCDYVSLLEDNYLLIWPMDETKPYTYNGLEADSGISGDFNSSDLVIGIETSKTKRSKGFMCTVFTSTATTTTNPATTTPVVTETTSSESPKTTSSESPKTTSSEIPKTTISESPETTISESPKTTDSESLETTSTESPETTSSETPLPSVSDCTCGSIKSSLRVIGGVIIESNQYPFLGFFLDLDHQQIVGVATLISLEYAITANVQQHKDFTPNLILRFGVENSSIESNYAVQFKNQELEWIEHPDSTSLTNIANIGLVKFQKIEQSALVSPICLPSYTAEQLVGKTVTLAGPGVNKEVEMYVEYEYPDGFLKGTATVIPVESCQNNYFGPPRDGKIICATGDNGACLGDDGAPLFLEENGIAQLVGLSEELYCYGHYDAAAFVNVAYYLDWIRETTNANCPPAIEL